MSETTTPKCYSCKWRCAMESNAHSGCLHPDARLRPSNLRITAALQGIRGGWFYWPSNFDPVWLDRCDGYTPVRVEVADPDVSALVAGGTLAQPDPLIDLVAHAHQCVGLAPLAPAQMADLKARMPASEVAPEDDQT